MKDQFVPYEIALKLKELGFDKEHCFGSWTTYPDGEGFLDTTSIKCFQIKDDLNRQCLAPLYQQVFQFLRDKFNFSGNIDCCDNLSTWNIKSSKLDKGIYSNKVQSYNDAQNECIQEIIKLIENEQ